VPQPCRFVGREAERSQLAALLQSARSGRGELILIAGEAGIGKTRLVGEALREASLPVISASASETRTSPYGPVVQVLRTRLRNSGHDPSALGHMAGHLAPLLPELGPPGVSGDRAALFEAVRCAFAAIAEAGPVAIFLDDLHWADDTTLELLPSLREAAATLPLLLLGAYRSEQVLGDHPVRRLKAELRRKGWFREITLGPLSREEAAELVADILGGPPSPSVVEGLHARTQGVPFLLEELTASLGSDERIVGRPLGTGAVPAETLPLPESIREAILLRTAGLSFEGRQALEVAAVLGDRFAPELVAEVSAGDGPLGEAFSRGLLVEDPGGHVRFRHALTREAVYQEIAWDRRRVLHRTVAGVLEVRGAPPDLRAAHWLAAREPGPAREALRQSMEASCRLHAYQDALRAGREALRLWPRGEDEPARLALLYRLGSCAELSGDLAGAAAAWTEVSEARRRQGNLYEFAEIQRRLASVHAIQGAWERSLASRRAAAEAFTSHGLPAEAAVERLMAAEQLEGAGQRRAALELVVRAEEDCGRSGRNDLTALALGFEGYLRAQLGDRKRGLETLRRGLALALEHNLSAAAAEVHYRLAYALVEAGDYRTAHRAFQTGIEYCRTNRAPEAEQLCLACYAGVLVELGEWHEAEEVCRGLESSDDVQPGIRPAVECVHGILLGLRGRPRRARRTLLQAEAGLGDHSSVALELSLLWGLAIADELDGATDAAVERIRALRSRWEGTDDLYYVVHPLRWAVSFLAGRGLDAEARACTDVLASVATAKGSPETLAALAHALGECAVLDDAPDRATEHFEHSLEILGRLGAVFQHAHTRVRSAVALAAAGNREEAVARFVDAHRTARRMGARPLAASAARGLRDLGESVEQRLGRRARRQLDQAGLTRRELQVLGLVNQGGSNREIARRLFLSPRTVEMHVSNALRKLGCSTRTEAAHRARQLGVIG
jgi:DNA-binding CsgD family transcriptional regulator